MAKQIFDKGKKPRVGQFINFTVLITILLFLVACNTSESITTLDETTVDEDDLDSQHHGSLISEVYWLAREKEFTALQRPPQVRRPLVKLGQFLMFDKIISGNKDISCMTCHLPRLATGDERHLSIGQGGSGLGKDRTHPESIFEPRHAPPLFNMHVLDNLFWDGRVEVIEENGQEVFRTPAAGQLTQDMIDVFEFGAISALGLFPVENRLEMRGVGLEENELAAIPDGDFQGVWTALMKRLGEIPQYRQMFEYAYPGTRFEDMTFAHASNAMAGFMVSRMSATDTPWDRFLRGQYWELNQKQLVGAKFYLNAPCAECHSGAALTDNDFHNVVLRQLGDGKGDGPEGNDDFGREQVTGDPDDRYKFRSTPLRNVEFTAPYGHAGQFVDLTEFIFHYSNNADKIHEFDKTQIEPLLRDSVLDSNVEAIIERRDELIVPVNFTRENAEQLNDFMSALTDRSIHSLARRITPRRVPSGLPIDQ